MILLDKNRSVFYGYKKKVIILPSSVTHSYFAMDVYQKLNRCCQKKIEHNLGNYKLFSQGSDPFMFYHFLLGKKANQMKQLQNRMHHEKTQDFFLSIINYIHQEQLQDDSLIMSYLYGYICHYYLDAFTHPFIYYKSGFFVVNDKNTYQYNGLHQEIEYRIDSYFIEKREHQDPSKFRIDKFIFETKGFSKELEELIQISIGKVYDTKEVVRLYEKSIWYMKKFFRLINYDPYGWKLKFYQLLDKFTSDKTIRLEELSFYSPYLEKKDYLNLAHQKWNYPWDKSSCLTTSFLELYDMACQQAVIAIQEVTTMLNKRNYNEKRLKEIFANWSFATGIDCKRKVEMKYFEF